MPFEELADQDLTPKDVQGLSSPDALAGFFARLGYDTNARLTMTAEALRLTAENTRRPILRIERLADQESLFQVYLFEVKSITRAHTRSLARHFRNLGVPYFLLVLAAPDYERVDFVLLEFVEPAEGKGKAIGTPQATVRPRILSVERRKPTNLDLRVLRRFTWTEPDPFAQYDKLLAAYTLAEWSEEEFNNRALFADYFLLNRLPEFAVWREDPKPTYRKLRDLYRGAAARLAGKDEAQLRRELLEPALETLGLKVREGKPSGSDAQEPDYELLSSEGGAPLAICLAYPWNRFLDGKDPKRDRESPEENPGALVVSLLEQGRAPWAVVTNGRLWRLYAAAAHAKATSYYEIDLDEVLSQAGPHALDPTTAFRYFWLLFRRDAFEPQTELEEGQEVERSFHDGLLRGSQEYARELGERLKGRVFTEVFPHLAEGFLRSVREAQGSSAGVSQDELDGVFQGTLTLLYRLLFLLYAEARDLLPVREVREYALASLKKIKEEIAEAGGDIEDEVPERLAKRYGRSSSGLWERLVRIFRAVDRGDAALNLPSYNGGLFLTDPADSDTSLEAETARFLQAHAVSDFHLALALDRLARDLDPKRHSLVPVDYKSLGVRQLGSIYEGLLEFRLRIAGEKLAVVKEKGREVYKPFSDLEQRQQERAERQRRVVRKGGLYLENDRHERKTTGSYYTPDFVVKYIVEQAVGPVLTQKLEALRPRLREADKWRRNMAKLAAQKGEPPAKYETGEVPIRHFQDLIDAVFDVKVLDPAMGSGHFLVEAVDFLTDKLLHFLNAFPWNPVRVYLDDTRREILESAEAQEVTLDPARLTDVHLLKRHVLKRCVHGVDLNPMAVELAKVSLWLHCFTLGAPLSFLDHHLRCGNSLVGVAVDEVQKALGEAEARQALLFGSRFAGLRLANDLMRQVGELSDVTISQVDESRSQYRKASEALAPFKRVLDVYTSQWFGNGVEKRKTATKRQPREPVALTFLRTEEGEPFLNAADDAATEASLTGLDPKPREVASRALEAAQTVRFFHWDLEFPEVFYGPREGTERVIEYNRDAGFDAVVGNPPYVRMELIKPLKPFLKPYYRCHTDRADLYIYFYERGLSFLRDAGYLALIASSTWTRTAAGRALREFLKENTAVLSFVDFGDLPLFPDATTYPCVAVFRKGPPPVDHEATGAVVAELRSDLDLGQTVDETGVAVAQAGFEVGGWRFEDRGIARLRQKIMNAGIPLKEYCGSPLRGIVTGLNDAFVVDLETRDRLVAEDPKSAEILKPFLEGKDLKPWRVEWRNLWLIYTHHGIDIDRYPAIKDHLQRYKDKLEKRATSRSHAWYELQQPQYAYFERFSVEKIMYPHFSVRPTFSLAAADFWGNDKTYAIPATDYALLGLLNSSTAWFFLAGLSSPKAGGFRELRVHYMDRLPVPFNANPPLALHIADIAHRLSAVPSPPDCINLRDDLNRSVARLIGLTREELATLESTMPRSPQ